MAKEMTVKEAGSKGGKSTLKRLGREHFQKIGKIGGSVKKKK